MTEEITEADREAAIDVAKRLDIDDWATGGGYFSQTLRQAFARHRTQARQAALSAALVAIRDCMVGQEWPPTNGDRQIDEVLAVVRSLMPSEPAKITGLRTDQFPDRLASTPEPTKGE